MINQNEIKIGLEVESLLTGLRFSISDIDNRTLGTVSLVTDNDMVLHTTKSAIEQDFRITERN